MALPGFDEDGTKDTPKRSGYEEIVKDLHKPERTTRRKKSGVSAAVIQLLFGYVGGGYIYLEDKRKGLISAAVFILGAAFVVYLEMMVFPAANQVNWALMWVHYAAVAVFLALAGIYLATVADCYMTGSSLGKRWTAPTGGDKYKARELTPAEKLERVFSEHDREM